jgi:hypothetical protein
MFPYCSIHKYAQTSPDGKTYNEIDHVLMDKTWHSNIVDVPSLRGADFDTDHYLVIVKVGQRL